MMANWWKCQRYYIKLFIWTFVAIPPGRLSIMSFFLYFFPPSTFNLYVHIIKQNNHILITTFFFQNVKPHIFGLKSFAYQVGSLRNKLSNSFRTCESLEDLKTKISTYSIHVRITFFLLLSIITCFEISCYCYCNFNLFLNIVLLFLLG